MSFVSVIIPTRNRLESLCSAIESVLAQTFKDLEIIVVDDGSKQSIKSFLRDRFSNNLSYFYKKNGGPNSARNLGIKKSSGKFAAFLDDDDLWYPEKIERQLKKFSENSDLGMVYCSAEISNMSNFMISKATYRGNIFERLLEKNHITGSSSSVLVKREVFDKVGCFDESLRYSEDYEMWLRIASEYEIDYVDDCLVRIQGHDDNASNNISAIEKGGFAVLDRIFSQENIKAKIKDNKNFYYSKRFLNLMEYYYWHRNMKDARRCFYEGARLHKLNLNPRHLFIFIKSFIPTYFRRSLTITNQK
jgi:glycosyltransferase involved in cell wall biosynthesis